jgi:hypothetical protein
MRARSAPITSPLSPHIMITVVECMAVARLGRIRAESQVVLRLTRNKGTMAFMKKKKPAIQGSLLWTIGPPRQFDHIL